MPDQLSRGNCAICGKEIPVYDIRDKKAQFCSRAHAAMSRYAKRYRGTFAGPQDRPNLIKKLTEL